MCIYDSVVCLSEHAHGKEHTCACSDRQTDTCACSDRQTDRNKNTHVLTDRLRDRHYILASAFPKKLAMNKNEPGLSVNAHICRFISLYAYTHLCFYQFFCLSVHAHVCS